MEMAHVLDWARENKMAINLLKPVELVYRRPNVSRDLLPAALSHIKRVCDAKLFGVYFRHDFNFSKHIDSVVATCNQRLYLLGQLAKQGLGIYALDSVFKAIVLSKNFMCLASLLRLLDRRSQGHVEASA